MLQPVTGGNRPDVDCAHKFIVETIFTPDGELTSLERLVTAAFPVELALGLTTFSSWGPACIGGGGHVVTIAVNVQVSPQYSLLLLVCVS